MQRNTGMFWTSWGVLLDAPWGAGGWSQLWVSAEGLFAQHQRIHCWGGGPASVLLKFEEQSVCKDETFMSKEEGFWARPWGEIMLGWLGHCTALVDPWYGGGLWCDGNVEVRGHRGGRRWRNVWAVTGLPLLLMGLGILIVSGLTGLSGVAGRHLYSIQCWEEGRVKSGG